MITVMFDDCEVFLLLSPYSKLICSISDRMESIPVSQAVGRILSDLIEVEAAELQQISAWCMERTLGTVRDDQCTHLLSFLLLALTTNKQRQYQSDFTSMWTAFVHFY